MSEKNNCKTVESNQLDIQNFAGESFEIDFGGHLKAKMIIENGILKVTDAMNGWGDKVDISTVSFILN